LRLRPGPRWGGGQIKGLNKKRLEPGGLLLFGVEESFYGRGWRGTRKP